MKKVIAFVATAVLCGIIIISSCSKTNDDDPTGSWVCHCVITSSGSTNTVDIPLSNVTLSYATSTCATAQTTYTTGGNTATCTIN